MDARTRERLPVLPLLARCAAQQHGGASALLHAARQASPAETITAAGQVPVRATTSTTSTASTWAGEGGALTMARRAVRRRGRG